MSLAKILTLSHTISEVYVMVYVIITEVYVMQNYSKFCTKQ